MKPGAIHAPHIHPHSVISGTYYVTAPPGSGAIRFEDPQAGADDGRPAAQEDGAATGNRSFVDVAPKPGMLLLWESWLRHGVEANRTRGQRVSIELSITLWAEAWSVRKCRATKDLPIIRFGDFPTPLPLAAESGWIEGAYPTGGRSHRHRLSLGAWTCGQRGGYAVATNWGALMTTEIQMLLWAVVLGLVQLVIATMMATKDQGLPYNLTPRDLPAPPVTPVTARLGRAFKNFMETFGFFAVAVLAVTMLDKTNATSALGAEIYLAARVIYVPIYAAGIPVLRTLIWAASIAGLVMVLAAALS